MAYCNKAAKKIVATKITVLLLKYKSKSLIGTSGCLCQWGAACFMILRPVIDTTIKATQNVSKALTLIAKLGTE